MSDLEALEHRLDALESKVGLLAAENVALRSKLVELAERTVAPPRKSIPAPPEPAVKIYVDPPRVSTFIPPTREEANTLRDLLGVNYPQLLNTQGEGVEAWLQQFGLALRALTDRMYATQKPVVSRDWFVFREICAASVRKDINAMPFLAAVLATACRLMKRPGHVSRSLRPPPWFSVLGLRTFHSMFDHVLVTKRQFEILPLFRECPL